MVAINSDILIITLTMNCLSTLIKRQIFQSGQNNRNQLCVVPKKSTVNVKTQTG